VRVAFRADASVELGAGHVMRCLALADELRRQGVETRFLCRAQAGDLRHLIEAGGHAVTSLNDVATDWRADAEASAEQLADAVPWDWLVVDHYALDARWEGQLRPYARRLMVIDDLADRPHDCDLLLDQNLGAPDAYAGLLPARCQTLIGPRYALLRPQFAERRGQHPRRAVDCRRILVFFGGADAGGETLKALDALSLPQYADLAVDVVVGQANPCRVAIEHACHALPRARMHCQVADMATLMAAADLAIGAGGTTSWERCCLGLPSLVIAIADNQLAPAVALAEAGGQLYLGASAQVTAEKLASVIANAIALPELRMHLSHRGMELVDGRGVGRVANRLLADLIHVRPARPEDREAIYQWRNHPDTRAQSFDSAAISRQGHERWFAAVLADPTRHLLIGEEAGRPLGVLRYDAGMETPSLAVVSLYLVPGLAGRGYGTRLLLAGNRWLAERHPEMATLEAAIGVGNAASLGAFRAAGFTPHHAVYRKESDASP
jgi:UDP-2,4-diacetamido-2,4,6-trideoxy-beta-L-altropyranose hydrolase